MRFDAVLKTILDQDGQSVKAEGKISSDGTSMSFETIEISDTQGPWIEVTGVAPISLHPGATPFLHVAKKGPLNLKFSTSESQNWLDWLSSVSPFVLEKFHSEVELQGSLVDLSGAFDLQIVTQKGTGEHGRPSTSIEAKGTIANTLLSISNMSVAVAEERFNVSGSLNLPGEVLEKIDDLSAEIPWETTGFNLRIPPSKLTPLRYFAPQLLSTGGEVEADLKGSITGGVAGVLKIKGVNTRAIFPFGSLRDISADLKFEKSLATLNNISANIGREPVTIAGALDYRDWNQPSYRFTLTGDNLPLIRKPGLLLRSDLNLIIDKKSGEATAITGDVTLKNGLYLLNRSNLLAGGSAGGRTASTRPPYFSVDIPPLSGWDLNVAVKGDHFIRIKTPASDGVLSLDMKLQGKLKEPYATGRLEFDQGNIYFPFSSFTIDYGIAELPVGNPYVPTIEIMGSSRRFGYDIGVEITGTAYDPQVTFTSSPPLASEQIMLMVMTGENPEGMFDYSSVQRASKLGAFISKGLFAGDSRGSFFNRLSINSGENLSEQGKETIEIEYALDERFQFIGEYDEYDFWNTGIRWRIFQRKPREPEKDGSDK